MLAGGILVDGGSPKIRDCIQDQNCPTNKVGQPYHLTLDLHRSSSLVWCINHVFLCICRRQGETLVQMGSLVKCIEGLDLPGQKICSLCGEKGAYARMTENDRIGVIIGHDVIEFHL